MKENPKTKNHLDGNNLPSRIYPNNHAFKDISGQCFGLVNVLYPCDRTKDGKICYVCLCECGQFFKCSGKSLRGGMTKSCGCWHKQRARESNLERGGDLTGQRFGKLIVVKEAGFVDKTSGHRSRLWLCECDCGGQYEAQHVYLVQGEVKSCGCLRSAGELKINEYLIERFSNQKRYSFSREKSFEDLLHLAPLRFDFAIYDYDQLLCLIEFHGEQHYRDVPFLNSERVQESDKQKEVYCKINKISLHVIPYNADIVQELEDIFANEKIRI